MTQLAQEKIVDGAAALSDAEIHAHLPQLPGWELLKDSIRREWRVKNFSRAAQVANVAAWLAESANHHPDIAFGWGNASVTFTTHSAGGVTLNDLIMAARLNLAVD